MTLAVQNLEFGYATGAPIVSNVDAEFGAGQMTALVGRSGSGKSTLLYILGLMLTPTGGSVVVDGTSTAGLADWARAEIRAQHMGFVFQDALLDPARSVLDNVLEGALYSNHTATQAQALALLDAFEVTVDPRRKPGQISGGQAQRVALCRAFVSQPSIVLADEPTGNLDDDSASIVWTALRERANNGAVVVVATHDRTRARLCDTIVEVGRAA